VSVPPWIFVYFALCAGCLALEWRFRAPDAAWQIGRAYRDVRPREDNLVPRAIVQVAAGIVVYVDHNSLLWLVIGAIGVILWLRAELENRL